MTLYETIFKRRSVRTYEDSAISDEVLTKIKTYLSEIKQLDGQQARFEVVESKDIGINKAPYCIMAFCEDTPKAYINVGFCLQEMDLFIQSINLGSFWFGMAKPKEKKEDFVILLAFGKTDVPFRKSQEEFKRLEVDKISNVDNAAAKAARLAPSAVNSQPWQFRFESDKVLINYFGRGLLKAVLKKKFSKIDIGIAAKHMELALESEGKKIKSIVPNSDKDNFGVCISYDI